MSDRASVAGVWLHDAAGRRFPDGGPELHLRETMEWLRRAQDATGSGGVSRCYTLAVRRSEGRRGWMSPYPETTGYIIPTFYDYALRSGEGDYRDRALAMARWECDIQMESGAVMGGVHGPPGFPPTPAVFNTGQVLFGWARAYRESGEERFRAAARRGADFLVEAMDEDGAWRRHGSKYALPGVHVYDARTAWGLLEAWRVTGDARHRDAARRNLDYVCARQEPNGWFPDCCLDDPRRPLLHTLAYTMEGLLEGGLLLEEERHVAAARRAADALLERLRPDGGLAGRFDAGWRNAASWSCLTGNAQTALVWLRLERILGTAAYGDAAVRLLGYLRTTQDLRSGDPGVRGGVAGSFPRFGEYGPYEFLNWAAKFFADGLLLELERGRRGTA
ncbi:MAG TPA: pectate lyase [Candidatus Eisenbacteria bacterium]|nr:pectate lyase [Candidatus Eisenbacteria bacterium]